MANPVEIYFQWQCGAGGQYQRLTFGEGKDVENVPSIERSVAFSRPTDQGYSESYRIPLVLKGFIEGNSHSEVMTQYEKIKNCFGRNDLRMTYKIGNDYIYNNVLVYVDSFVEPSEWKEYNGDFIVNLHFFEVPCLQFDLGIRSYYHNDDGILFTFEPPPLWEANTTPSRPDTNDPIITPFGRRRASKFVGSLHGTLHESNQATLKSKMEQLSTVFQRDGELMYNGWTNKVRITSGLVFNRVFPRDYATWSVGFSYYDSDIEEFEMERSFSNVHRHTKITTRLYCLKTEVEQFHESGQFVDYNLTLKSSTRQLARTMLYSEINKVVSPNGYLMSGGGENWVSGNKISWQARYYYETPVLPILTDTIQKGVIPTSLYAEGT